MASDPNLRGLHDVRMRGFSQRATVEQTLAWLDGQTSWLEPESVDLDQATGRVLADDAISSVDVPSFARSMMDGYAVQADATHGASSYNGLPLDVIGESLPGRGTQCVVTQQTAVRIMTGAPMPEGADAVLPIEKVEVRQNGILILDAVPPGKHVGHPGEDIKSGQLLLTRGRRLRPQDVGVLASIGFPNVNVVRQPAVRILVTGNELVRHGIAPSGCRIVDSNSPMLRGLIERDGGVVNHPGIVPDDPDSIRLAMQDDVDVIVVSGGSSVGQEDHAPVVLEHEGELAIHGVAMRPSSPVGMGKLGKRLVFLLPGNPVSCLCAYDFFAGRALRVLGGRSPDWPYARRRLPLRRKLVSVVGRVDYARVGIVSNRSDANGDNDSVEPIAISGASVLSSTTRADGFVIVPSDSEGFPPGAEVEVLLYDAEAGATRFS